MTESWLDRFGRYFLGIDSGEDEGHPEPITEEAVEAWVNSDDFARGTVVADSVWPWAKPGAWIASRALGKEVPPEHLFAASTTGAFLGILHSTPPTRDSPFIAGLLSRTAELWREAGISTDYDIVRDCMLFTINAVGERRDREAVKVALGSWLALQSRVAEPTDQQRSELGEIAFEFVSHFWHGLERERVEKQEHLSAPTQQKPDDGAMKSEAKGHARPEEEQRTFRYTIQEDRRPDGTYLQLTVVLTKEGALRLEGSDSGPLVEKFMGQEDHEYYREVAAEYVPQVLAELMKEKFTGESPFGQWLEARGIPSRLEITW